MGYLDIYRLDQSPKKYKCPECEKKTFVAYVHTESKKPVDETKYGRCDRENNCGYHEKPEIERKDGDKPKVRIIKPTTEVKARLRDDIKSPLHKFLEKKGIPASFLFSIGVYEYQGMTVYGFINSSGEMVNLKYFKYQDDGHRDKTFESFSLKNPEAVEGEQEEKYSMCLFLECELDETKEKIVCIVESEKSAAIAKYYYPEFDWVSCGSANGLSDGSEGTSDKITPLLGRTVYWICDADKAGRGKIKDGKWEWNSSIRNGIKHFKNKFHVVDLFPSREDGYDIGDALLDGLKPEIKPTWSAIQEDPRLKSYVPPNKTEVQETKGETCHIPELSNIFAWMRGHVCAWYGWPNHGKGTFTEFMIAMAAKHSGYKILLDKQEDMTSRVDGKKRVISADTIYDNLIWMITGQTTSEFYAKNNGLTVMPKAKILEWREWISKYIFVIYPSDRTFKNIMDEYMFYYEYFGIDIFFKDPWNTAKLPPAYRGDERLIEAFIELKEFALRTHTMFHIVNHPKGTDDDRVKSGADKGAFKLVTPNMQLGGSAWDIKMDAEYSIQRPYIHLFKTDPRVTLHNLKQREAERVGVNKGLYELIEFVPHRRQFYFGGRCPMDGSVKEVTNYAPQYTSPFKTHDKKKGKSFDEHVKEDWNEPPPHTQESFFT